RFLRGLQCLARADPVSHPAVAVGPAVAAGGGHLAALAARHCGAGSGPARARPGSLSGRGPLAHRVHLRSVSGETHRKGATGGLSASALGWLGRDGTPTLATACFQPLASGGTP